MERTKKHFLKKTLCIFALTIIAISSYIIHNRFKPIDTNPFFIPQKPKHARLVFAGDLMQHIPQVNAAYTANGIYDYTESFQDIKSIFENADIAILNLETTLTPEKYYTGYPLFRSPAKLADAIKNIGIDIVTLANNHICDNGRTGIEFTINRLDSLKISYTGAFTDSLQYKRLNPLRFSVNQLNFALLNYTYDTNGIAIPKNTIVNLIDTSAIALDLKQIDRTTTDCVIVFFHWGDEYIRRPNKEQHMLANFCHTQGVELVIGSHPHVIQPFETSPDKDSIIRSVTVYSLGNLVSNQRKRYRDGGLIVTFDIEKKGNQPVQIKPYYTPVWVQLPKYRIIPAVIGDTLSMPEYQRTSYNQFMEDTRALLKYDEIFEEI